MSTPTRWTDDHFVAGDIALDFANTVFRRTPELGADLLDSGRSLTGWFGHAGLLPPTDDPPAATEGALPAARRLRDRLWVVVDSQREGGEVPADALTGLLEQARSGVVTVTADGTVRPRSLAGALAAVALAGIRLVLTPPPRPVRSCDRCGWYFLDTSRGRRRRWCSMKTCGNQAKAARFRDSHS
ncbi:CGNR zinc finger domain-containing protein [Microlunatus speluncae]|uniref:CGNR zinc finger domain-containing protein n=1 Tax=Microlunatus speluncae TaxID=2594267 RepID=UPI0012665CA0|nr:ABATE domain-containing protein [Microlunatus speluncae]